MSKQIKFKENFDCYAKGEVATFDDDLADVYIKNKVAEECQLENKTDKSDKTDKGDK